ncbi:hypothetical protein CATRI_02875 [Corynebacterium atrinae]|uniref:TIGR03089 family protein n=1 Tax=Corynebacterium atrinae TaxID=1336740 RepID=UPI0025B29C2D|nr:TIGR03089 family protein [Corynebacterium atrinae]WJY62680.1 hypothetical protein CATRI_02875 [Corynebacterium atrinae]
MDLLEHLLAMDPAAPRLTVYNDSTGMRLDFSAQTLDNWASKIANMLLEELDLDEDSSVLIDLPVGWQAATIALGCLAAGVPHHFGTESLGGVDAVFTSLARFYAYSGPDIVLVSDDPFGRGIVESGGELPDDAIDFGPTVRFYGDQFFGPAPSLRDVVPTSAEPARVLSTGWHDDASFAESVLVPLSAGGSAVVVSGMSDTNRLDEIATAEKVTQRV